jgi:glyoxylase-like metal-dependent hydrolase (beta-lactamase superfamily II)
MKIEAKYHPDTATLTYIVWDEATKDAVIIDPVLDYNPIGSKTDVLSVRDVLAFVERNGLNVHYILETHAHADHITGAQALKKVLGAKTAIGEHIRAVQETFKPVFGFGDDFATDGSQFDELLTDGQVLEAGSLKLEVIHTPGHTPACLTFKVEDALFTGDALFMPDSGTGRCDFPKGDAENLYDAVTNKLYKLPDATRVFVGHDYQPGGRALAYETTIGASKAANIQLKAETSKEDFVKFRKARDKSLAAPRLLFQSVSLNIAAGKMPNEDENGIRRMNMPINLFRPSDDEGAPKSS